MNLQNARLVDCNLRGSNMRAVLVRGADFSGCDLGSASLRETDLTGVSLERAKNVSDAVIRDVGRAE